MNMLLVQKDGFDPNLADGYDNANPKGNTLALQLVLEGEKLQPANPSFSDARNAILAADQAITGGQNQFEIWSAFARRGMGFSFTDGGSKSTVVTPRRSTCPRRCSSRAPRPSRPTRTPRSTA